jgi:hypothetical protein
MQEDKVEHMPTKKKSVTDSIETVTSCIKLNGVWVVMVNKESMKVWEPSIGTSHRLPKLVLKQQLDKQNYNSNQQS